MREMKEKTILLPEWRNMVAFAQQRFAVKVRPDARAPGKPPCHRVPAVRHEGPDAASERKSARREPTCPDGPAYEANRALCERRAGESCRAPVLPAGRLARAPRTRARQARPAAFPVPRRTLRSHRKSVAGFSGTSFRCASLRANRLCRAQTPIAPQPTCQRSPRKAQVGQAQTAPRKGVANLRENVENPPMPLVVVNRALRKVVNTERFPVERQWRGFNRTEYDARRTSTPED